MKKKSAYAGAGVDIELGNRVKETLPELLASTKRNEVLGQVGGFGGLFALNQRKYEQPILVSSVDGVGTKLKIAFLTNRHDTIGQDLVNHCVNDIAVLGAEPLFFLDYLGTGTLKPHVFSEIVRGFAVGCRDNGCALIGGETAQMPGFYQKGEYDVSGTIVGVVDKERMLNGQKSIRNGDVIIGLASSGLHTNGYSLARKILFDKMGLSVKRKVKELGCSVGDELLKVHVSYWPLLQSLLKKFNRPGKKAVIKGLAHITGGGFIDNIPRVLPPKSNAMIERGTWPVLPIFELLQREGRVDEEEMFQAFNMGIGMIAVVSAGEADAVLRSLRARKKEAWKIGSIRKGAGKTVLR
ncbi:MAG: phosphoribosylformylglycinamidine cyclo-ligase [Verrucomicrobiales bacterium]|nr:phosphoribosylformylglycinamidine cyclo-ligase [Verrucomicrobiales bacterium]|tara:strand:- start:1788 stop:2846 length:1059 start_codon:yes stop_codon:yes gene_type:complete